MKITAPFDTPLIGAVVSKITFGVKSASLEISLMPCCSSASPLKAVIAMGVSCKFSSRFWAVTTISSICCAQANPFNSRQAPPSPIANLSIPGFMHSPISPKVAPVGFCPGSHSMLSKPDCVTLKKRQHGDYGENMKSRLTCGGTETCCLRKRCSRQDNEEAEMAGC